MYNTYGYQYRNVGFGVKIGVSIVGMLCHRHHLRSSRHTRSSGRAADFILNPCGTAKVLSPARPPFSPISYLSKRSLTQAHSQNLHTHPQRPGCYLRGAAYDIRASAQRWDSLLSKMLPMDDTCEAFTVGGGNTTPPPTVPAHPTYPTYSKNSAVPAMPRTKRPSRNMELSSWDTSPQSSSRVVMVHPFRSSPVLPSPLASEQSSSIPRHSANALSWVLGFRMTEESGFGHSYHTMSLR